MEIHIPDNLLDTQCECTECREKRGEYPNMPVELTARMQWLFTNMLLRAFKPYNDYKGS